MMVEPSLVLFYVASAITLGGALGVVMTRNIVYASFALLAAMMGVAGVFLLVFAEFLALVQILIYGGAVVIVLLFALMLTRLEDFQNHLVIQVCLQSFQYPDELKLSYH